MKVRPLHDRILLKRIEEKESIKGGIIIPDTAKEKPQEGLVVAVGNGKISGKWNQNQFGSERWRSRSLWEVFGNGNQSGR